MRNTCQPRNQDLIIFLGTGGVEVGGICAVNAVLRKPYCLKVKDHLHKPEVLPTFHYIAVNYQRRSLIITRTLLLSSAFRSTCSQSL